MIAHVTTSYRCNYNCEYCYLGDMKKDPTEINVEDLKRQLTEIEAAYGKLERIDVYGGEITLLPLHKIIDIIELCKTYAKTTFVTNLSNPSISDEIVKRTGVSYAISVNDERPHNDDILERVMLTECKPNAIIQVATPSLMAKSPKEILDHAALYNTEFIGFTQYFPSEPNQCKYTIDCPNKKYADFLIGIIKEYLQGNYKFKIENILDLDLVLANKYKPWMTESIFIMPGDGNVNKYACILYNRRGVEHFHFLKDLKELDELAHFEYFEAHTKHGDCKYFGKCYAEHLRPWDEENDECPGLYSVLEWYKDAKNRKESVCETD